MEVSISLVKDFNKWSSSSSTLRRWIFGIFENGIFFESFVEARILQIAQVTSAKTDMDICCKNCCKRVSFKPRRIGSGQGARIEGWILPSSCSISTIVCFCFSSFLFFLFVWLRFFCWLSRHWRCSSVSFARAVRVCSLSIWSRICRWRSVSLVRSDRLRSLFFSCRICRCSSVSSVLLDWLRFLCFWSRTSRCFSVSFIWLNRLRSLCFLRRSLRCSSVSAVRFDRLCSLFFSSRICRCSSVSFARFDRLRSLCFSSRRWCCSSWSFGVFSFEFGTVDWVILSSMVSSLRKRRLGEDWNSGILIWVVLLFLNVLFSGV